MLQTVQEAIATRPTDRRLVLLSDYDGTLAELHPDPSMPLPSPRTAKCLRQLAARDDLSLGIVSGRRISDLRTRTQVPSGVYLAGLHGMEIEIGSARWQHPDLDSAREHVRELYGCLSHLPDQIPGLIVEDKHASVAIHVRGVAGDQQGPALRDALHCASAWVASGKVRALPGSDVLEFVPNVSAHKGEAVRWIAAHVHQHLRVRPWVVFLGDDLTDEDAFQAIDEGIGVLVGSRDTFASDRLQNTTEVADLLEFVAASRLVAQP